MWFILYKKFELSRIESQKVTFQNKCDLVFFIFFPILDWARFYPDILKKIKTNLCDFKEKIIGQGRHLRLRLIQTVKWMVSNKSCFHYLQGGMDLENFCWWR